jgi:hypothetical protein
VESHHIQTILIDQNIDHEYHLFINELIMYIPNMAIGASRSNRISCSEKILVADLIKNIISFSASLTSVPTFLLFLLFGFKCLDLPFD